MNTTMTRHTNLRNIIELQKRTSEMTYGEQLAPDAEADDNQGSYLQDMHEKNIGMNAPSTNLFSNEEMDSVTLNDFKILSVIG